jgi:hypothetical protein
MVLLWHSINREDATKVEDTDILNYAGGQVGNNYLSLIHYWPPWVTEYLWCKIYLGETAKSTDPDNSENWISIKLLDGGDDWITVEVVRQGVATCTQSFTANSNVGELPFTPAMYLYKGSAIDPTKLLGAWDIPADIDLTIGSTYTAYPTIPSSYKGDEFTAPNEVTFTACEETINFVYAVEQNGGVYTILIPVVSTNLKAVGWSYFAPTIQLLEVEFLSGSLYLYYDVPGEVFYGLLLAPSKGFYFWLYIRCKTFDCSGGDIPYAYKRLR